MKMTHTTRGLRARRAMVGLVAAALVLAGCGNDDGSDDSSDAVSSDTATADADATEPAGTAATSEATEAAPEAAPEGDDVVIEYLTFSAAPDHLEDIDAIVAAFEEENPGTTIDVQTAAFDDYFTQLQTRVAGGDAPDTFELNYENFVTYADADTLLDLSGGEAIDESVYYPAAYEVFNLDGVQYGLPETFSTVVLFYNKDIFDAAGVDYPTADWTWEDEMAAAEQLTDADAGVWGDFQPVSFFEYFKVLAQNGGQFFNDDKTEVAFDTPEGVEAAEWLLEKVGTVMPTEADMGGQDDGAMFASGQLAMWHTGIWMFAPTSEVDFAWDVAVEPGNVTDAHHFFTNAVVASSNTEHPEEAAAWLQFMASSDTAVQTRLASDWELPAVSDESLFDAYLEQGAPDNRQAVFDSLDEVVVPPVIVDQAQMQDAVSAALEAAKLGQIDAQTAIDQAAGAVQALLE